MNIWQECFSSEYKTLVEQLRNRSTLQPINQGFDLVAWESRLVTAIEADTKRLIRFGSEIYRSLSRVRDELKVAESLVHPNGHRGHLVLLYANSLSLSVEESEDISLVGDEPLIPDFLASSTISLPMNLRATMVSFVETTYDSIRFPVPYFCRVDHERACEANPSKASINWAQRIYELACLYGSYEYLWGRALWAEAILDDSLGWHIAPSQRSIEQGIAVAKHISEVDKVQTPMELASQWNELSEAERMSRVPPRATVSLRKGRIYVHWDWASRDIAQPPMELVAFQLIQNRLPLSMVNLVEPCPGTSVTEVLRVRELLSQIGAGITEDMRGAHPETVRRTLCAALDRAALIASISIAAQMPAHKAEAIVDLFTLRDSRSEFWFQPLVDLGGGRLGFALHPLRFASSIRTLEWLLSRDHRREGDKGRAFEDGVAEFLEWAAGHNDVVNVKLYRRLSTNNEIGDIDIVCVYGDLLLVMECKCPSLPSSDNDFFNREKALRHASRQADRKAAYVCENLRGFLVRHGIEMAGVKAILPLVMVSGNEYVGSSLLRHIPIVSKGSISLALANRSDYVSRLGSGGSIECIRASEPAARSVEEVLDLMLMALNEPPLIARYQPYVTSQIARYSLTGDAPEIVLSYFEVAFDEDSRRKFVEDLEMPRFA